jgi:hypothetical protein
LPVGMGGRWIDAAISRFRWPRSFCSRHDRRVCRGAFKPILASTRPPLHREGGVCRTQQALPHAGTRQSLTGSEAKDMHGKASLCLSWLATNYVCNTSSFSVALPELPRASQIAETSIGEAVMSSASKELLSHYEAEKGSARIKDLASTFLPWTG